MRTGGIQTKHAAIDHVRQPSERMPVARGQRDKRPFHPTPRHAGLHNGIFGDVKGIVIGAKAGPRHRQVQREGDQGEQQGDAARLRHGLLLSDFTGGAKRDSIFNAKSFCNFSGGRG